MVASGIPTQALPRFSDATLRDSAHMAGVEFTPSQAASIADVLIRTGVERVEVGMISGRGGADDTLIEAVHDRIGPEQAMSLVVVRDRRQVSEALDAARDLGVQSVMLSIPTSPEHAELKLGSPSARLLEAVAGFAIAEAKQRGLHVTFSGEDGARTEPERLMTYVSRGFDAGADRFRLAETVACLSPWQMEALVSPLVSIPGAEIEIHSHNMLGMAVANSIAAFRAGAAWISATVGGIGERGGNAPLAELMVAFRLLYGDDRFDLSNLTELTSDVLEAARLGPAFQSGPTTDHAFAYELPGQLLHPSAYETVEPRVIGNSRSLQVRTRIRPALVRWALGGHEDGVVVERFVEWLVRRQLSSGDALLDQSAIQLAFRDFESTTARVH